jgi:hypothetical protein
MNWKNISLATSPQYVGAAKPPRVLTLVDPIVAIGNIDIIQNPYFKFSTGLYNILLSEDGSIFSYLDVSPTESISLAPASRARRLISTAESHNLDHFLLISHLYIPHLSNPSIQFPVNTIVGD